MSLLPISPHFGLNRNQTEGVNVSPTAVNCISGRMEYEQQQPRSAPCAFVFATWKKCVADAESLHHLHSGLISRHRGINFTNTANSKRVVMAAFTPVCQKDRTCLQLSRPPLTPLPPPHPPTQFNAAPLGQPVREIWHRHLHSNKVRANLGWWIIVSGSGADFNFSSIKDSSSSVRDSKGSPSSHIHVTLDYTVC